MADASASSRAASEASDGYGTQLLLFLATIASTTFVGSLHGGREAALADDPSGWLLGVPFAATLMSILIFHEGGHYLLSRIHRVRASLPYFIPMPIMAFGTMGAIIVMRSRIHNLRALIDIGAAGPIAGFLLAVPALFVGVALSEPIAAYPEGLSHRMGDNLLTKLAILTVGPAFPEGGDLQLHPVAFAGWIGLFVTSLNLLPAGQLDGGHVLYAFLGQRPVEGLRRASARVDPLWTRDGGRSRPFSLFGYGLRRACAYGLAFLGDNLHHTLGLLLAFGLLVLGLLGWSGWILWGLLLLFFGLRHPPTRDDATPIGPRRRLLGWTCLVILLLSFTPAPFQPIP